MKAALLLLACLSASAADWFPVPVIADGKPATYRAQASAAKPWRLCALLPNGSDKFWWGVSWGLSEEAKRLHIQLGIYSAGDYANLNTQRAQLTSCLQQHADAILLAAVSPSALDDLVTQALGQQVAVIDLLNQRTGTPATVSVISDTAPLGRAAAQYALAHAPHKAPTVAWFPGPRGMIWAERASIGLHDGLAKSGARIIDGGYGDVGISQQMTLVRKLLADNQPDIIIGNSVAAEAAGRMVGAGRYAHAKVIAYYPSEPVVDMVRDGTVQAVVANLQVIQSRIAVDVAVKHLEGIAHPRDIQLPPEIID
ncbi:MAG: TMAO reductase system periplasmic protein TorT, partial [Burkholderiales bacterium]|nr:TMAO reductase system periplasmic protein TorT [Burkholderiales bacterium]